MNSLSAIIKTQWRLLVFILGLVFICWLVWTLISVLLPFIVGFIIAYVLLPIIRWIEKHLPAVGKRPQLKRITIIVLIDLLALAVIGFFIFYIVTVMGSALLTMAQNAPQIIPNVLAIIKEWIKSIPVLSAPAMQEQIDSLTLQASVALSNAVQGFLSRQITVVEGSSGMLLGFISMPIFVFFILKDWDKLRDSFQSTLPKWAVVYTRTIYSIVQNITGRYIRGQLTMSVIIGILVFIMLTALKIEFALPLAVWAALMELVPMLGVWLSILAGVIIALSSGSSKVIWVIIGYVVIQQIENNVLVPKIQGSVMKMNPIYIILVSVIGAYLAGLVGFIIAVPVAATLIAMLKYFRSVYHLNEVSPNNEKPSA